MFKRLIIELTDSPSSAASSLSDSTVDESRMFPSFSAVRGWVSRLQVAALRVFTQQSLYGVRPEWDARTCAAGAGWVQTIPVASVPLNGGNQ